VPKPQSTQVTVSGVEPDSLNVQSQQGIGRYRFVEILCRSHTAMLPSIGRAKQKSLCAEDPAKLMPSSAAPLDLPRTGYVCGDRYVGVSVHAGSGSGRAEGAASIKRFLIALECRQALMGVGSQDVSGLQRTHRATGQKNRSRRRRRGVKQR